jgi:hypothetical protein
MQRPKRCPAMPGTSWANPSKAFELLWSPPRRTSHFFFTTTSSPQPLLQNVPVPLKTTASPSRHNRIQPTQATMVTKKKNSQWWKPASISTKQPLEKEAELKIGLQRFARANQDYRILCDVLPLTQRPPFLARLKDSKNIRCIAQRTAWLECRIAKLKRSISYQQRTNPTDVNLTEDSVTTKRKQCAEMVLRYR